LENKRQRINQIKINYLYFICCDDKLNLENASSLYEGKFLEGLGKLIKAQLTASSLNGLSIKKDCVDIFNFVGMDIDFFSCEVETDHNPPVMLQGQFLKQVQLYLGLWN
jgi:hypothetical protein